MIPARFLLSIDALGLDGADWSETNNMIQAYHWMSNWGKAFGRQDEPWFSSLVYMLCSRGLASIGQAKEVRQHSLDMSRGDEGVTSGVANSIRAKVTLRNARSLFRFFLDCSERKPVTAERKSS